MEEVLETLTTEDSLAPSKREHTARAREIPAGSIGLIFATEDTIYQIR
jgi:hypothetical protein